MNKLEKTVEVSKSAETPCHVVFNGASKEQIKFGGNDDPNSILTVGKKYKVKRREVHSWHTKIELEGINGIFNDVSFTYST